MSDLSRRRMVWCCLFSLLATATARGGDTNWPHYGYGNFWKTIESPHRVRWHDGYDGPELVRLELATNAVLTQLTNFDWVESNRVVRVIANSVTNEVHIGRINSILVKREPDPWVAWSNKWIGIISNLNVLNSNMVEIARLMKAQIPTTTLSGATNNVLYINTNNYIYYFEPKYSPNTPTN